MPKKAITPPEERIESVQLDLFRSFITNNAQEVSNTIEDWEAIPKYFLNAQQIKKHRNKDGLAAPYIMDYMSKNRAFSIEIQPASIGKDNKYMSYFPTQPEEYLEEVLRKIFLDQQFGTHDPNNEGKGTWVFFSLNMLRTELERISCSRTIPQIKHSLEIMSKTRISVFCGNEEIYSGNLLPQYLSVSRENYLTDSKKMHAAQLPILITNAINTLHYRQYNYLRFGHCKNQITRYMYKRLVNRFTHANNDNYYHFMYSDIKQNSGLLQRTREVDNRQKIISAMDELIEKEVLLKYELDERKSGRAINDIKYTVFPSPNFIKEQKAANKRVTVNQLEAEKKGLISMERKKLIK